MKLALTALTTGQYYIMFLIPNVFDKEVVADAGLSFLISRSADPVAAELAAVKNR
jgi:hypothetical protein